MKSLTQYLSEASSFSFLGNPKGGFGEGQKRLVAYKIDGVNRELRDMDCATYWRRIQNDSSWKKEFINTKGKRYRSAIKEFLKNEKPQQYMLVTRDEDSMWHSDHLEIYVKK